MSERNFWKNVGQVSREMRSDSDRATAFWKCESESSKALQFIGDALVGFVVVTLFASAVLGAVYFVIHTV